MATRLDEPAGMADFCDNQKAEPAPNAHSVLFCTEGMEEDRDLNTDGLCRSSGHVSGVSRLCRTISLSSLPCNTKRALAEAHGLPYNGRQGRRGLQQRHALVLAKCNLGTRSQYKGVHGRHGRLECLRRSLCK